MAENKTQRTRASVKEFVDAIEDDRQRADVRAVMKIMRRVTGKAPRMWGDAIIGFGDYHYVYESGREGDWFLTGLSPRKKNLSLYIMAGFAGHAALLKKLGKHKTGKACLYVNKLDDVDLAVLEELIHSSVQHMNERNA